MWRYMLDACTVLGGLSALFYFAERIKERQPASSSKRRKVGHGARRSSAIFNGLPMPTHVVLALQWVITIYIFGQLSRGLPAVALLLPIWSIPLGLAIHRLAGVSEDAARIVGGIGGGIVGAAVAYAHVDWATGYGLSTGLFFGTLVSETISNPSRQTPMFSAVVSTAILLSVLGVFHDLRFFGTANGDAFIVASLALALWLGTLGLVRELAARRLQRSGNR